MTEVEKSVPEHVDAPEAEAANRTMPKQRRKVKIMDIVVFALIIAIIVGLLVFILGRLQLKNEVNQAKVTTNAVIAAMAKQDTAKIRSYGDKSFQAKNTAASLSENLTSTDQDGNRITFAQLYGPTKPTVAKQIVANNSKGQHVVIIYRYDRLKVPFFVRVVVAKVPGSDKWTLQALSASPDESKLLTPQ